MTRVWLAAAALGASLLLAMLGLPLVALALSVSPWEIAAGLHHPAFAPALWTSLRTTVLSVVIMVVLGTPLSWWLATTESTCARWVGLVVHLPMVVPPAVVGVALLQAFGRRGWLGPGLDSVGLTLSFTVWAVVVAQVVVAAPLYVHAARTAFAKVDPDMLIVARTLGATEVTAFWRVAVPIALPGLVAGASLAWARALGEFGATLLFAGNYPGRTQTLPLAIFTVLETDVRGAVVFSLALVALGALLLLALQVATRSRQ